jgi:hypothetical protein
LGTKSGAQTAPDAEELQRRTFTLSRGIVESSEQCVLDLRHAKVPISFSGLVEVALHELLKRKDLARVVRPYKIGNRRRVTNDG